jgi:polyhydroxyalkanoate synthesis regulator phasin
MAGLGNFVQKAFYLGVGIATAAGEQAGDRLVDLRQQAQKLADEMVARGELKSEEARRMVDDMMQQAKAPQNIDSQKPATTAAETAPRRIEILDEADAANNTASTPAATTPTPPGDDVDAMRRHVESLQAELERLQRSN